jgi:hypothetical protein
MVSLKTYPSCPACHRDFKPGEFWSGANFCRGRFLLPMIQEHPGLSAWELSRLTKMPYAGVTKGLQKLREWALVDFEAEDRENGGQRYRYSTVGKWQDIVETWTTSGLI